MKHPFIVGIAGGSGSGKTTLAEGLKKAFPKESTIIHLDDFFVAEKDMPILAGEHNHDDPISVNLPRLIQNLSRLIDNVEQPNLIVVEGFLLLHFKEIRELLNLKIFLEAPFEVIAKRRVHPMWDNYLTYVLKPMYERYVLPSSQYADIVFDVSTESQKTILRKTTELVSII